MHANKILPTADIRAGSERIKVLPSTLKVTWLLLLLLCGAAFLTTSLVALRAGFVPSYALPLPALSLAESPALFGDWRIAALAGDPAACRALLLPPHIQARPAKSNVRLNGCGWANGFKVTQLAGATLSPRAVVLSCEEAAALALWMVHSVQPAAQRILGSRVVAITHMGTYNCRSIRGQFSKYTKLPSQHSFANAIDISGFKLANGRTLRLIRDWNRGKDGAFLQEAYEGACEYFRVKLGPKSNKGHRDHFHLDRGFVSSRCST